MRPFALDIPYLSPIEAYAALAGEGPAALFDHALADPRARHAYVCAGPVLVIDPSTEPDPFAALERILRAFRLETDPELPPFQGGAAGVLGYELGGLVERLPEPLTDPAGRIAAMLAIYDVVVAFEPGAGRAVIVSTGFPETEDRARMLRARRRAEAIAERLAVAAPLAAPSRARAEWQADARRGEVEARFARAIDYIHAGDVFQVNLSQGFRAALPDGLAPFDLYRRLRTGAPGPFSGMVSDGDGRSVLSVSPERFLRVEPGGAVETRPIKGTRPRGATPALDRHHAEELLASGKDRAENLMIVDLMRNDFARVCAAGSVTVPTLCGLESFPAVHHLVSVVTGQLRAGLDAVDCLQATFPGGSITGAPKIRAMEIIHELERAPRGAYCGAMLWAGFDGAMDASILIRMMSVIGGTVLARAGAGIVADSDPAAEYAETMTKARAVLASLDPEREPCWSI